MKWRTFTIYAYSTWTPPKFTIRAKVERTAAGKVQSVYTAKVHRNDVPTFRDLMSNQSQVIAWK